MGKIIRNGIEFCGTCDTADNIIYDNTESGLNATTTQGAIDELSDSLGNIGSGTYYDEETDTLYLQGGSSNYTYDSDTEILYLG